MVIDSSALLAILFDEPEREEFISFVEADPIRLMSAATLLEAAIVWDQRQHARMRSGLNAFLDRAAIDVVDLDQVQAQIARSAYAQFGRGNHPAKLNMGDCFSYALAKKTRQPLLFKGDDFSRTDIDVVGPRKGRPR